MSALRMDEEAGDTFVFECIPYCYGKQFCNRDNLDLRCFLPERDCITDDNFVEDTVLQIFISLTAQDRVSDQGSNASRTFFHHKSCTFRQGASSIADIVNDDDVFSSYVA